MKRSVSLHWSCSRPSCMVQSSRHRAARRLTGADFEVDPVLAEAAAQSLGARLDDRRRRWTRRITSGSSIGPAVVDDNFKAAALTPQVGRCCTPAPPVLEFDQAGNLLRHWGGPGAGLRVADQQPRHHRRSQRQRLDWRQRRQGHPVLKFTKDGKFLLQIGKQGVHNGSNDLGEPVARGEDLRGPDGERDVHRRRLRQPPRHRVRRRHRQIQAPLGRLRREAGRRQDRRLRSRGSRRRSTSGPSTASSSRRTASSTSAIASTIACRSSGRTAPS